MENIIQKTSYIIGFRKSSTDRYEALLYVLSLLRKYFPKLEIILVEQDDSPITRVDESLCIRQFFFKNAGLYNRCRAFNYAVEQTDKELLVFADSDMFLSREDFLTFFSAGEEFEAVTPTKDGLQNVKITDPSIHSFALVDRRDYFTFAGGILLLTRAAFDKIGGWDERFKGWGKEDDAISHVIFNKITSKTFFMTLYHIDHSRTVYDGHNQPNIAVNQKLLEEIQTMNGRVLDLYIDLLKKNRVITQPKTFVLAVTTFNRPKYLKALFESFFKTRNTAVNWKIIIADDGSADETSDYLEVLQNTHNAIIIRNKRTDIIHQVNTILKQLSNMEFDLCFRCDDDVLFLQKGWDDLYWNTIEHTGYDHLIFYDKNWRPSANRKKPIKRGGLISNCEPEDIQGGFYTLTKRVLKEVGYFDEQIFGRRGFGHIDYSFRCCRAGFNVLSSPFDVVGSNDFLRLQAEEAYTFLAQSNNNPQINTQKFFWLKKNTLIADRKFIPFNESFYSIEDLSAKKEGQYLQNQATKKFNKNPNLRRADASFYLNRGIGGFFGFLLKRLYNIGIDTRLYFIPIGIKSLGRILSRVASDIMNIEQ